MPLERVGFDEVTNRTLYQLSLGDLCELPDTLGLDSRYFICMLVLDARAVADAAIRQAAGQLLRQGAVYFCTWGPDCGRVHDLVDAAILEGHRHESDESLILTTWHESEPFDEALWYFLNTTCPADAFFEDCRSAVAISVGSREWAGQLRVVLGDPRAFSARVLAEERGKRAT